MTMKRDRAAIKRTIWVESIAAVLFIFMLFNRNILQASGAGPMLRVFCDAFTVPGLLLLLSGLLMRWYIALRQKNKRTHLSEARRSSKFDYEKGRKALQLYCRPLIIVGGIHFALAVMLTILFCIFGQ